MSKRWIVAGGAALGLAGVATALENAQLFQRERQEKDRMTMELEEARKVQLSLFPERAPQVPGFEMVGLCLPCREVGGDWYDYITLRDGRLALVLADVSGKGMGAALLMASTRSLLRLIAERETDPGKVLSQLNHMLIKDFPRTKFVTMIYAVVDPSTKTIEFSNAGHLPPLLVDSVGSRFLEIKSGLPLGIQEIIFTEYKIDMPSGSRLLLYSGGVSETMNSLLEEYGTKRIQDGLKIKQGDYENEELGKRMTPMIGDMLSDWERYAKDRKTVIFAVNVAHSKHIQEMFSNNGYACDHLDGETPNDRRDEILNDLRSGKTQIVTNCQVLSEGWDEPSVSCVILARPTMSYGLYLQMTGRICRPSEGKTDSLIIDHAGSIYKHGFPQDSGGWELSEEAKIDKIKNERLKKEPHPVTCMECFTVYTGMEYCPECGCKPTSQTKSVMMEEGRLYEVKRQAEKEELEKVLNQPREHTMEQKAHFYGQLKTIASRHGYRQGWVAHKYKERYRVWPNHPSIKQAPMLEPTEDTLNFIRHTKIRYAKRRQTEQRTTIQG